MPVYWVYVTAWATPDGVVQFRDDIYQRDGLGIRAVAADAAPPQAPVAQVSRPMRGEPLLPRDDDVYYDEGPRCARRAAYCVAASLRQARQVPPHMSVEDDQAPEPLPLRSVP